MKLIKLFLTVFVYLPLMSCASLYPKSEPYFSESSIEKIPLNISREKLEEIIGKPSTDAEHEDGVALYYDTPQAGHYTMPLAKFAFNKENKLIGKTWHCSQNCEVEWKKLKERYPASGFVVSVPTKPGRKLNYGPHERIYTDASRNMKVEVDGDSINVIHWDLPGSVYYLNR